MKNRLLLIAITSLIPAAAAMSAVISYQEGATNALVSNYAGTSDTILASTAADSNFGGSDFILVGRNEQRFSIIRFDLSSLAGAYDSITSASLTLTRSGAATAANFDIVAYSLFGTNGGWDEMQATWNNQNHSQPNPWANGADVNQANVLGARQSELQTIPYTTTTTSITINIPVAMILEWINTPGTASSLYLSPLGSTGSNSNAATLGSSENATLALRPLLTVTYDPVPEPSTIAMALGGLVVVVMAGRRKLRSAA